MNVLIISSSPRKGGNSEVLCEQFAKGASEAGHEVEMLLLRQMSIAPCRACYACMETHRCAIGDDMEEVFQKLLAADAIVLASPVYFYSVSARLFMGRVHGTKGMSTGILLMRRLMKWERRCNDGTDQKEFWVWLYAPAHERRRSGRCGDEPYGGCLFGEWV